jgi:hypothetical protein
MTLPRPTAALRLQGGGVPGLGGPLSPAEAAVRRLRVDLSVDEAHDRVELWLWRGSALAGAEPGATLSVGLGDGDAVEDVLTVDVAGVDAAPWGAVLTGFAPSRRLSAAHVGRAYVDQSLADVVRDLLGEAEVAAGQVDATIRLPVLHLDPRRSVWGHLHGLADRSGHQVTSAADGAVSFTQLPGAGGGPGGVAPPAAGVGGLTPSAELREGAELLAFRAGRRPQSPAAAVVTPSAGTGARWHLLAAEPDSGSGPPVLVDPVLRTREAADAAGAAAIAAAGRRTRVAGVTVPGRPSLRAGVTVTARAEQYRVLRARHLLDAEAGYVCELTLEGDR